MSQSPWADAPVDLRVEVTPPWPFRIGRGSGDGILRRRGASLVRLLHVGDEPVLVAVVQTAPQRVLFAARSESRPAAEAAIERMRFATGVDEDLRPFHERFAGDAVIGKAVRANPHLRIHRRPAPWEALAWSITEQLIELERALEIQRRLVRALRPPLPALRDARHARAGADRARSPRPSWRRSTSPPAARWPLRHAAREVASGRIDLSDRERAWPRLMAIPNVGRWTLEMLSLYGQGHYDLVPAGDLGFIKLIGRLTTGHPKARADEAEVRGLLRALRGVEGAGRRVPVPRRRRRDAHGVAVELGASPSPGRNSLVSAFCASGGRLSSCCWYIQSP